MEQVNIAYSTNFKVFDRTKPLLVCFHGNSSSRLTFLYLLGLLADLIQVVAPDLPGCGDSGHLDSYSMSILGQIMSNWITSTFNPVSLSVFGHSLGGHLIAFLNLKFDTVILAGTPPLSSSNDFPLAFYQNAETAALIPLLSKADPFTDEEARLFVSHTGVTGEILEKMITQAVKTDGKFRIGCLSTITEVNQVAQIECMKKVVIFHALEDGVIREDYLESLNKDCLFEGQIHYVPGKHMSPILQTDKIVSVIKRAFCL